jgi:hypothetical protein
MSISALFNWSHYKQPDWVWFRGGRCALGRNGWGTLDGGELGRGLNVPTESAASGRAHDGRDEPKIPVIKLNSVLVNRLQDILVAFLLVLDFSHVDLANLAGVQVNLDTHCFVTHEFKHSVN